MKEKQNILYIVTDQQSAHMMSCAKTDWVVTPNLDRLAERGILFSRAYCGNPVCIPSRFSLFTGYLPEEIGLRSNQYKQLDECPQSILNKGMGHLFKQAGYRTVYGGKQHFPGYEAEDIGFEVISKDEREELSDVCCDFLLQNHDKPWLMVASFINPHDICYKGISDWIDNEKIDKPGFKDLLEYKTMKKYDAVPDNINHEDFYNTICPSAPDNIMPQNDEPQIIQDFLDQRAFKRHIAENYKINDWRMHRYIYKKLTEEMDRQIGKVLDALESSSYKENTLIIFTSDHGDMDGSHRLEHKTVLYEEAINIPLILAHKSLDQGVVSDILCSNALDLIPTLLNFAGIQIPEYLDGVDLIKAYNNEIEPREYVPIESEIGRAIVTKDFKYVMYDYGKNNEQLYDYKTDKLEMYNHINKKENLQQVKKMKNIFNDKWSDEQRKQNYTPLANGQTW